MKKQDRQKVHDKYGGKCAYCGDSLERDWQVDHAISKCYWFYVDKLNPKGVDHIDNLMPACRICNHYKRSFCVNRVGQTMGFRDYMAGFHLRLKRLPKTTAVSATKNRIEYMRRIAAKYKIETDKPFSGVFYFETITNDPQRLTT